MSLQRLTLLATACLSLCATQLGENVFALPMILLALVVGCLVTVCARRDVRVWSVYAWVVAVVALCVGFGQFWFFARSHLEGGAWLPVVATAYSMVGAWAALSSRWQGRTYVLFLAVHLFLLAILVHEVPIYSDVRALVDGAADALLHGADPYDITVPAVYSSELDWIYGPGVLVDGRITFGYPYLPVPLLVLLPAFVLGDLRLALVLATVLTSWLLRRMATDWVGRLCAVLVLVMPVSWWGQLNFWIEPILVLWVALMASSLTRNTRQAPMWFGLLLASKQFAVVLLPLLWSFSRLGGRKALVVALGIPAVLCSAFFVWDPGAFYHSAVEFHLTQPYRPDTVTLTPAFERLLGRRPSWLEGPYGFALGAGVSLLVSWRCRPSASTMAAGVALSLAVSVLFSKQGHVNYWALIGGALLVAVAAHRPDGGKPEDARSEAETVVRVDVDPAVSLPHHGPAGI